MNTITGELTHAGTMMVRDEELTGVFVSCTEDGLSAVEHLPFYQPVTVIEAAELDTLRRDREGRP